MRGPHSLSLEAERRVMLALFVQPFVAALLGFALFPVVEYTGRVLYGWRGRPVSAFDSAVAFGLGVGIAGVLVTAFGAFPAFMWLLKRGRVTRMHALIAGAVLGNVPGALILGLVFRSNRSAMLDLNGLTYAVAAIRAIVLGSLIGAGCAAIFWWIAGRYIDAPRET